MSPKVKTRRSSVDHRAELAIATGQSSIERGKSVLAERAQVNDRTPYGPTSEHSWVRDMAASSLPTRPADATERLNRFRSSGAEVETRAIGTGTLGGLVPSTIPPYVAEAVAYGVRSGAPLAVALERLDLPPVGTNVAWAKVTTAATVTNQTAQNTAITASADPVVGSVTDPLQTIAANVDFSAQAQELSGGWFDRVIGEELGRAFGARLEQQVWAGTGSSGQITGFTVMTGNSSSTVAGQTLANQTAKMADQFSQVSTNLGALPDLIAMAPRRYAGLQSLCNALGLPFDAAVADALDVVVSPAAPLTLGAGSEDWIVILNRAAVPLVREPEPRIEFHQQGPSAGTDLTFRWLIYAYVALGVSRRPEGVGLVKGLTAPAF